MDLTKVLVISLTTALVAGLPATLDVPQHSSRLPKPSLLSSDKSIQQEARIDPRLSFNYRYQVKAKDTGDEKSHHETLENGVLVGSYSVVQPDGTLRTVTYRADDISGFQAKVQFQENYADPTSFSAVRHSAASKSPRSSSASRVVALGSTAASEFAPPKFISSSAQRSFPSTSSRFRSSSAAFPFDSLSAQEQSSSVSSRFTSGLTGSQFDSTSSHTSSFSGSASSTGAASSKQASRSSVSHFDSTSSSLFPQSRFTSSSAGSDFGSSSSDTVSTRFASSAASKFDSTSLVDELPSTSTGSKLSPSNALGTSSRFDSGFRRVSSSASRPSSNMAGSKFRSSTSSTSSGTRLNPAAAAHFGLLQSTGTKFRSAGSRRGSSFTPASTFVLTTGARVSPSSGTLTSRTQSSTDTHRSRFSGGTSGQTSSSFSSLRSGVTSSGGVSRLQATGFSKTGPTGVGRIADGASVDHLRASGATAPSRFRSGTLDRASTTSSHSRFTVETSSSRAPGSVSSGNTASTSSSRLSSTAPTSDTDSQDTKFISRTSADQSLRTFSSGGSMTSAVPGQDSLNTGSTASSKLVSGTLGHSQRGSIDSRTISEALDEPHGSVRKHSVSQIRSSSRFDDGAPGSQTSDSVTRDSSGSSTLTAGTSATQIHSSSQTTRVTSDAAAGQAPTGAQFQFPSGTSARTQVEHSRTPSVSTFLGFIDEQTPRRTSGNFGQVQSTFGSVSTGASPLTGRTFESQALDSFNSFSDTQDNSFTRGTSDNRIHGSTRTEASRKSSETSDFHTRGSTLTSQFPSGGARQDLSSFSTSLTDSHTKFGSATPSGQFLGGGSTFTTRNVGSQTQASSLRSSTAGQDATTSEQSVFLDSIRQSGSLSLPTGVQQRSSSFSSAASQVQDDGSIFPSQRLSSGLSGFRDGASRSSISRPTFRPSQQSSGSVSAARRTNSRASQSGDQQIPASHLGTQQTITSPSGSQRTRISHFGNQQTAAPLSSRQESRTSLSTNQQIRTTPFSNQKNTSDSRFQQQSSLVGSSSLDTKQQQPNLLLQLSGGEPLTDEIINGSLFITNENLDGIDAVELARNGITGQSFAYRLVSIPIRQ